MSSQIFTFLGPGWRTFPYSIPLYWHSSSIKYRPMLLLLLSSWSYQNVHAPANYSGCKVCESPVVLFWRDMMGGVLAFSFAMEIESFCFYPNGVLCRNLKSILLTVQCQSWRVTIYCSWTAILTIKSLIPCWKVLALMLWLQCIFRTKEL
jgi:hypothetical protein